MKTRREIEVDFVTSCNQAQELINISSSLSKIAGTQMVDTLAMLASSWQGENAEQFTDKTEALRLQLLECADDLNKIAGHISFTAKSIYQAELINIGMCC